MKTLALSLLLLSSAFAAQTLRFDLNRVLETGVDGPESKAPWASVTFTDLGSNKVKISIDNNLTGSEFISSLSLNLNSKFSLKDFTISGKESVGCTFPEVNMSGPAKHSGMGSKFDINLFFERRLKDRFMDDDKIYFVMNYTGKEKGFSPESFNLLDDTGLSYSMAHVQSIGVCETSAWITTTGGAVPEPSCLSLVSLIFFLRRKR